MYWSIDFVRSQMNFVDLDGNKDDDEHRLVLCGHYTWYVQHCGRQKLKTLYFFA